MSSPPGNLKSVIGFLTFYVRGRRIYNWEDFYGGGDPPTPPLFLSSIVFLGGGGESIIGRIFMGGGDPPTPPFFEILRYFNKMEEGGRRILRSPHDVNTVKTVKMKQGNRSSSSSSNSSIVVVVVVVYCQYRRRRLLSVEMYLMNSRRCYRGIPERHET